MDNRKPKKGLFTKGEGLLMSALLALAILLTLCFARPRGGNIIRVYLNGELYAESSIFQDRVIVVEQPGGERNELVIADGRAWMRTASCKNQDCVHQSPLTAQGDGLRPLGDWIICLPNRVSVELVKEEAK